MIQFDWLIPGQQNLFDEEEMEQIPFLLEEKTVIRELEFIPATCKVIEYYNQSYCCPSYKEGLGDTEKPVSINFQVSAALVGKSHAPASTVAWIIYRSQNNV